MAQSSPKHNVRDLILLDNQVTVDLFCNNKLVTKTWTTDKSMTVYGNGGQITTNMKANVRGYGDVWYDPKAITNIMSLKNVKDKYHVTYDSQDDGDFIVTKPNGSSIRFVMHDDGLHYHDTNNRAITMVQTVKSESEGFTNQQVEQAKTARAFQAKVGHPSTQDLKTIIKSNFIVNCPVTTEGIDCTKKVYGSSC